jgi:hypothetical protein
MKKFKVNKSSWHYRFQEYVDTQPYYRADFCSYWRGLVLAIGIVSIVTLFMGFLLCMIVLAASLTGMGILAIWNPAFATSTLGSIVGVVPGAIFWGSIYGIVWLVRRAVTKSVDYKNEFVLREPGILATKYRSLKDRVCYKVEFYD